MVWFLIVAVILQTIVLVGVLCRMRELERNIDDCVKWLFELDYQPKEKCIEHRRLPTESERRHCDHSD